MFRSSLIALAVIATVCAIPASGDDLNPQPTDQTDVQTQSTDQSPPPAQPPAYNVLRWQEDYSVLGDEPRADWLDLIKYVPVGSPHLRATFGGQFRFRFEHKNNEVFGSGNPADDTYALTRVRVHADLNYMDVVRFFVEGKFAFAHDRDRPTPSIYRDDAALQNLFVDVTPWRQDRNKLVFRIGRQELLYGKERLVSSFDWANVMRTFDGARVMLTLDDGNGGTWQIDGWWTRLARGRATRFNDSHPRVQFYGVYAAYAGEQKWGFDLYALGIERNGVASPNQRRTVTPNPQSEGPDIVTTGAASGTEHRMTLGGRFWTKTIAPFDFEAEGAWQVGRWDGDAVSAWMAMVELGYTVPNCEIQPRFYVGYDFASGDNSPNDGSVGTFNQLFPLGHAYLGFVDVVGRQNIHDVRVGVAAKPLANLEVGLAVHNFWLAEEADALYNAGGAAIRRDATGGSGSYVGSELDLFVKYKLDRHSAFLVGYSHFWAGDFVNNTGPGNDVDFFYTQYQFTF